MRDSLGLDNLLGSLSMPVLPEEYNRYPRRTGPPDVRSDPNTPSNLLRQFNNPYLEDDNTAFTPEPQAREPQIVSIMTNTQPAAEPEPQIQPPPDTPETENVDLGYGTEIPYNPLRD
jgi:hypothetical protein